MCLATMKYWHCEVLSLSAVKCARRAQLSAFFRKQDEAWLNCLFAMLRVIASMPSLRTIKATGESMTTKPAECQRLQYLWRTELLQLTI